MTEPAKRSSSRFVAVVEPPLPEPLKPFPVRLADEYLQGEGETLAEGLVVLNLCRSYHYLSKGYYVSLLAEARQQRSLPTLEMIEGMNNPFIYLRTLQEAGVRTIDFKVVPGRRRLVPKVIAVEKGNGAKEGEEGALVGEGSVGGRVRLEAAAKPYEEVVAVFGRTRDERFRRLAAAVYRVYSFPLLKLRIYPSEEGWRVAQLAPVALQQLEAEELALTAERLTGSSFSVPRSPASGSRPHHIACLWDAEDPLAPSDGETLEKFARVAARRGVLFEVIGRGDLGRLAEYDALLIRTVTAINHVSFTFSQRAESLGMPVIDDPGSIVKCSNKIFLYELFRKHGLAMPETAVLSRKGYAEEVRPLGFPVILKLPDGTFSQAVKKAKDPAELDSLAREMFKRSPLLIAQRFTPTPYDWRIGVLEGEILWAAKYHMAKDHWQIARRSASGKTRYGKVEAVPIAEVPEAVKALALAGTALIGDGLYGVDIKETEAGPVIIEINDNPNLETGYEDTVEKERPYQAIIDALLRRVEVESRTNLPRP